ncbi:MAG: cell division protein ZipA [Gammaproteobacteria bacterium]|uniref:Cell division protein ZipA n=1 Tax=Marinobacter litoralis TaxID=187981 RepID=A0A3M2R9J5_9GAMM|nr:cell division protein ZipA [Marinobacter litoralis]MBR9869555.1 cell division protein ZipA [Gammaproteobacteria bacterium]RMJ01958.1 Cell division protein ZipA [Marinobacter litoralis]
MSLREWLIAIGTLVIIGIVVDGIRRMHRARKESIAISSGMGLDELDDSPLDSDFNPELPNGGARIVSRGTLEEQGYLKSDHSEPLSSADDDNDFAPESGWGAEREDAYTPEEPKQPSRLNETEPVDVADVGATPSEDEVASYAAETTQDDEVTVTDVQEDTANRQVAQRDANRPLAGANRPEAKEVLVINVLSPQDKPFEGVILKKLFEACGLEFGDLDIYHRHEGSDTTTPVQFSVASAVEPGTFRPEEMPALSTPGISFFMSLPGPTNALQAFEFMLETAQCVVRNMGGELKDERRSVMTPQTIEHCRQRIREFERKQRFHRV